jgi:DNA mismatch endonuclease (patch repair protein)
MQAVKSRDTVPELTVRRLAHALGYRFRLHRKDLPGTPDLIFPRRRKVLFVNGCFWHGHDCARGSRVPVQNRAYWTQKIARNKVRDETVRAALNKLGWKVGVLWECDITNEDLTTHRLRTFLGKL